MELLTRYQEPPLLKDGVETQLILDTKHDHYQLVNVGWENDHRVYGVVVHIDIKDDKV